MYNDIGYRYFKRLHQQRLNLIDGSISIYCSILYSPKRLCMIKQANDLASVLCDIESGRIGGNDDMKKMFMDAEDHSKNKF